MRNILLRASFQAAVHPIRARELERDACVYSQIQISLAITRITRIEICSLLFVRFCYSEIRCLRSQFSIPWSYIFRRLKACYQLKQVFISRKELTFDLPILMNEIHFTIGDSADTKSWMFKHGEQ